MTDIKLGSYRDQMIINGTQYIRFAGRWCSINNGLAILALPIQAAVLEARWRAENG